VIDRLRKEIELRLEQLLDEAEKLRRALAALDPRRGSPPATADDAAGSRGASASSGASSTSATTSRTPSGATKARVLGALSSERGMTAGEVSAATGLARGTVSTTLTKLAKSGEVRKVQRGYQLRSSEGPGTLGEPGRSALASAEYLPRDDG
jgi:DNA-binding transcriptional ArsR family regulator